MKVTLRTLTLGKSRKFSPNILYSSKIQSEYFFIAVADIYSVAYLLSRGEYLFSRYVATLG